MADPIMTFGAVLFGILLLYLLFLAGVYCIASLRPAPKHDAGYRPRVSVLIPTYNEEARLGACIGALIATRYPRLEIIVIDDGSTDATVRVARGFGARVRLLRQAHKGKPAALNRGLALARGAIIVTVDADTIVEPQFIAHIVQPLRDPTVAAASGPVLVVNQHSVLGAFQRIEYHYNNLIRQSFSTVFRNGIWFFGCLGAYRATTLRRVGGFPAHTLTEDMDLMLALRAAGYRTLTVADARGRTFVPTSVGGLLRQRARWWAGGFQSLRKHRKGLHTAHDPAIAFLRANQVWWLLYALVSLPLIAYQVAYWFPTSGGLDATLYLVRWFTLWGPFYVLYKIPVWGLNWLNIAGVLAGLVSATLIIASIRLARERPTWRDALAIAAYFPYTIILNLSVLVGAFQAATSSARPYAA